MIAALFVATTVGSAQAAPPAKTPVTPADLRPPASMLVDCAAAPPEAVTKLPDELARWATVYCTKLGHIFNANDRHFGAFPDNGTRASFAAAEMDGTAGEPGNDAYFSAIRYGKMSAEDSAALINRDPSVRRVLVNKALWRLDLTSKGGKVLSFVVIDPTADPFWVFPLGENGLSTPAFYVTSLDALNRVR